MNTRFKIFAFTTNTKLTLRLIYMVMVTFLISCSSDDDVMDIPPTPIVDTSVLDLPSDVNRLFLANGNKEADTVMIYENGGPSFELEDDDFEDPDFEDDIFSQKFKNYYRVYAHQAETLFTQKTCDSDYSRSDAEKNNRTSVEILDRIVKNFKNQGKTVLLVGHSFGGFIITKYIAEKPNQADRILIMASRLDMQIEVANAYLRKELYTFKNGEIPTPSSDSELIEAYEDCESAYIVAGAMVADRFTQKLASKDLSNVLYVHAVDDEQTGTLSKAEDSFLVSKKARIIKIPAGEGGHSAMFFRPYSDLIVQTFFAQ